MTNVVKQKNSKCIEWTVQTSDSLITLVSETFLFLHRGCYLKLVSESQDSSTHKRSDLYFNYNEELKAPINLSVRFAIGRSVPSSFNAGLKTIRTTNTSIWSGFPLRNGLATFEISIYGAPSTEDKCVQTYLNTDVSLQNLSKDFSKLLDSVLNHDAEIKCGQHSIKAHKNVLCARSEVFKAMLESDMLEGRTGTVEIKDMDISYARDFVRYLYTGAIPEMTFDKTKALYEAGDKYDVRSLMLLCSEYLQDNLSPENACQCLALADIHSDRELKKRIITYILDEKIYLQDEVWLPVCENYPRIAVEVYRLSHTNGAENATTASSNASTIKSCEFFEPTNSTSEFGRQISGSEFSTSDISSNFVLSKSETLNTASNCVPENTAPSLGSISTNFAPSHSETLNATSNGVPDNTAPSFGSTSTNFVHSKRETLNATSNCVSEDIDASFKSMSTNFGISKHGTLNAPSGCVFGNTVLSFGSASNKFVPSKKEEKSETLNAPSSCVSEDIGASFKSMSTNFGISKHGTLNAPSGCVFGNTVLSFGSASNKFVPSKKDEKSETLNAPSSCVSEDIDASFKSISTNFGISAQETINATSGVSGNTVPSFGSISTNSVLSKSENPNTASSSESENTVSPFGSTSTNFVFGSRNVDPNQIPKSASQYAITASHLPPLVLPLPTYFEFVATSSENDKKRTASASGFYFGTPSAEECKNSLFPPSFNFGSVSTSAGIFQLT